MPDTQARQRRRQGFAMRIGERLTRRASRALLPGSPHVNNRVQVALSSLPQDVQRQGVNVKKKSSALLAVVAVYSPKHTHEPLFISNYVTINLLDQLKSTEGVGDAEGAIDFIDVTVDRTTDTVLVRATFPNPTGGLIDGQLVRVDLESGTPEEKVVVPQAALIADQTEQRRFSADTKGKSIY